MGSTRAVDKIRCDAGVLPSCAEDPGVELLKAVSKLGIRGRLRYWQYRLGCILPALRYRIRVWFLRRAAKKAATVWLLAHIPPDILAIPPDRLTLEQLMALRLIVDKAWREFDTMTPASDLEINEWLASHNIDPDLVVRIEHTRTLLTNKEEVNG